jgi:hypothetical protein
MSIKQGPDKDPLGPVPEPPWGEMKPEGQTTAVVEFVLADRTVSYPVKELKSWTLVAGDPERLEIQTDKAVIVIEGKLLATVRDALNESRLVKVRINGARPSLRPGPVVRAIAVETP